MINRFTGDSGRDLLLAELRRQKVCFDCPEAANEFLALGALAQIEAGEKLIRQNAFESEVHLIVSGLFNVVVNGREVSRRGPHDHVGEMAAITPAIARSADVVANKRSLVVTLSAKDFLDVADRFPSIWRNIAVELVDRLEKRGRTIKPPNDIPRVFIISSSEAIAVAKALKRELSGPDLDVILWKTDSVFQVGDYSLESLERELQQADFAIAVISGDDITISRKHKTISPRDNVIFEIGYFMGKLGKQRAMIMMPRNSKIKIPSDLLGITGKQYSFIAPGGGREFKEASGELRQHILRLGSF